MQSSRSATSLADPPPAEASKKAVPRAAPPAPGQQRGWLLQRLENLAAAVSRLPVYVVSSFWPKEANLWVFGAWDGREFSDNSRHLFAWLSVHHPEIEAVWCTTDPALLARLEARGVPCVGTYTKAGYRLAMRAGVAVISNSRTGDINRYAVAGKTTVVQLWHGTPIKKIGYDDTVHSHDRSTFAKRVKAFNAWLSALLFPPQRDRFDLLTAGSEATVQQYLTAFRIDRSKVVVTGLARTDRLIKMKDDPTGRVRRIVYLPTYRGAIGSRQDPLEGLDLDACDKVLESCNAELFVKVHPANHPPAEVVQRVEKVERIHFFACGDLHHHLPTFDLMITDFSSVYADWLLLDRPIVFFPRDFESYVRHDRELYYDYDWVTPGPKVRTWEDLLAAIPDAFEQPDTHAGERERVCKLFNGFTDGNSCERIFDAVRAHLSGGA